MTRMNNNVFINCPFDDQYKDLFDSILFVIYFCECKPRCALELDDGLTNRLEKICNIIKECDLGIHDISRTELNANSLPRFNMPFEFGIFFGAKKFGGKNQKAKICLIFDKDKYRYQQFISDISGQDIKSHTNDYKEIITKTRNWINTLGLSKNLPGSDAIISNYEDYIQARPLILKGLNKTDKDYSQYADKTQIIEEWIKQNPI
jgi:hypothetical protein